MSEAIQRVEENYKAGTLAQIDAVDMEHVIMLAKGTADEAWALHLDKVLHTWQDRNNNQYKSLDRMTQKFLRIKAIIDNYEREGKSDLGVSAKRCVSDIKEELDK